MRRELRDAIAELAARSGPASQPTRRVQPIVEVCSAENYVAWRQTRARRWRRERSDYDNRSWPDRIAAMTIAAVWLPQSHGGHYRGRPAEIALPLFGHGQPKSPDKDFAHPYEPLVLTLAVTWVRIVLRDPANDGAVLVAPPLIDLMTTRPQSRMPHDLGITWPLEPSKPHVNPLRQRG